MSCGSCTRTTSRSSTRPTCGAEHCLVRACQLNACGRRCTRHGCRTSTAVAHGMRRSQRWLPRPPSRRGTDDQRLKSKLFGEKRHDVFVAANRDAHAALAIELDPEIQKWAAATFERHPFCSV